VAIGASAGRPRGRRLHLELRAKFPKQPITWWNITWLMRRPTCVAVTRRPTHVDGPAISGWCAGGGEKAGIGGDRFSRSCVSVRVAGNSRAVSKNTRNGRHPGSTTRVSSASRFFAIRVLRLIHPTIYGRKMAKRERGSLLPATRTTRKRRPVQRGGSPK